MPLTMLLKNGSRNIKGSSIRVGTECAKKPLSGKRSLALSANTDLSKRPDQIPAWDSLNADQKRLYAHMMEVYAGALSHADNQIGRLLDEVEQSGQRDNTLIFFIMGDNGASAEGS